MSIPFCKGVPFLMRLILITLLKLPNFEDTERTRVARYLYYMLRITIIGMVWFMLVPVIFAYYDMWNVMLCSGILIISLILLFLVRLGYIRLASIIFVGSTLSAVFIGGFMTTGIRTPSLIVLPLILMICSLLLGNRATLIAALLCVFSLIVLLFYGPTSTNYLSQSLLDMRYFSAALLVISQTVLILSFTINQIVQSEQQIRQQAQELAKLNIDLQLEMNARVRTEKMLYQEQKLESTGLLVGGIAHDFNNLFTSILGQSSLAQRQLAPDLKAYRHLEKSIKATQQAAELTRQLLAYTGKSNVQSKPLDLNQLIEDNQDLMNTAVQQNTVLTLDLQPCLPLIEAASGQLQQVIMNLLINAAQAIQHEAGQITVTTRAVTFAQAPEPFDFVSQPPAAGEYVQLTVQDNGSGMPQAVLDRIFDPYFTTKENGHGLGLSAVLGIIQAHQGSLQVKSYPRQGSCFHIYLPLRNTALANPAVNVVPQRLANNTLILVIEDQAEVCEATIEIFHSAGYRTLRAADGYAGIALFRQHQATIGLVLLDVVMPGMTGVETLAQLRVIDPKAKVILTSGYSEHTIFTQMQSENPTDFLPKPYLADTLLSRVAAVLSL